MGGPGREPYGRCISVLRLGRGRPVTLFAPGGAGEHLDRRMGYAVQVPGTKVGFAYGASGHSGAVRAIRCQADRDAAEALAVATSCGATQAIGFSRGARAVVGAMAEDPTLFARVVLVIPPGGRAAGRYSDWLASRAGAGPEPSAAEIFVIGQRGDVGHPARVASMWAEQLQAHLELLPAGTIQTDGERVAGQLGELLA